MKSKRRTHTRVGESNDPNTKKEIGDGAPTRVWGSRGWREYEWFKDGGAPTRVWGSRSPICFFASFASFSSAHPHACGGVYGSTSESVRFWLWDGCFI